jgi:cell division protein FtsQ
MWDNPRLLNLAAGVLAGLAAVAFGLAAVHMLLRSALFPLREIELTARPRKTTPAEIEGALRKAVRGNFFAVDLAQLGAGIEKLPWVRRVELRRIAPGRIEVAIEEHVPLARWGDEALVNTFGERFRAESDAALPSFVGPRGSEAEVARRYAAFARIAAPLGAPLERVVLTPRYAWQLTLANGLHIMLGRDGDAAEARLRQFVASYAAALEPLARKYQYVDLRYPNGFVLRAPERKT